MKASTVAKILPFYAVIISLVFFAIFSHSQSLQRLERSVSQLENKPTLPTSATNLTGYPVQITLPEVQIDLPVGKGVYNNQKRQWVVSEDKADFATITAAPNNTRGITLIYAHRKKSLFGLTEKLKVGDKALIQTDNHLLFEYEYVSDQVVLPSDLSVFRAEATPKLVLLTCAGSWDSQRRLMFFKLNEVKNL